MEQIPCRFIAVGLQCKFSDSCVYSHDKSLLTTCPRYLFGAKCLDASCSLRHDSELAPICVHFIRSTCTKKKCRFKHEIPDDKYDSDCLICLNDIRLGKQYALLTCCDITVCMNCMTYKKTATDCNKKCPICKKNCDFVVPSNIHLKGQTKLDFINDYKQKLKETPCKFEQLCKWKTTCYFKH